MMVMSKSSQSNAIKSHLKGGNMEEIKKLGVLSVSKISALGGIVVGLVLGTIYAIMGSNPAMKAQLTPGTAGAGIIFSWWSPLIMTTLYGLLYFVAGLITAALYNLFAKQIGGITVELKEKKATTHKSVPIKGKKKK